MALKGSKELAKDLDRIKKGLTPDRLLLSIGLDAKQAISVRTDRGKDFRGADFDGYEDSTKAIRNKRGRQTSKVDLQMERHMLNNMQVKLDKAKNLVKIIFTRRTERDKAFMHNEVGVGRKKTKREFFALGKRLEDGLFKKYLKSIERLLK